MSNLGHINGGHIKSGGRAAREVLTRNTSDDATALTMVLGNPIGIDFGLTIPGLNVGISELM